jgi:hypothetical protein
MMMSPVPMLFGPQMENTYFFGYHNKIEHVAAIDELTSFFYVIHSIIRHMNNVSNLQGIFKMILIRFKKENII